MIMALRFASFEKKRAFDYWVLFLSCGAFHSKDTGRYLAKGDPGLQVSSVQQILIGCLLERHWQG